MTDDGQIFHNCHDISFARSARVKLTGRYKSDDNNTL